MENHVNVNKSGYLQYQYQLVIARFLKHQKQCDCDCFGRPFGSALSGSVDVPLASIPSPLNPSFCLEVCWLWNVTYQPSTMSCRWVFVGDIFGDNFWHIGTVWNRKKWEWIWCTCRVVNSNVVFLLFILVYRGSYDYQNYIRSFFSILSLYKNLCYSTSIWHVRSACSCHCSHSWRCETEGMDL